MIMHRNQNGDAAVLLQMVTHSLNSMAKGGVHAKCHFAADAMNHSVDSYDQNTIQQLVIQEWN